MTRLLLVWGVLGLSALLLAAAGQGAASAQPISLQEQIDRAQPGDTLTIEGGVYNERIVIDKPLTLTGSHNPVIDGGGGGDIVTITADDVTFSRFTIRNSGRAVSQEPAAIKVIDAHAPTISHNRIESAHFGIHVTGTHHATIDGNEIDLGDTSIERRGHAIYFWEVGESAVHDNVVSRAGDGIHLEFSQDNDILYNTVSDSRYALHFMYSDNNRIIKNDFNDNLSGAVLMFSHELLLKDNLLSNNRRGATGAGILLKDVDNIFVEGNTVTRNKYGLTADGAPQSEGATAIFIRNLFALNDTGLGLMSNAPITFVENSMIENTVQIEALGGSLADPHAAASWPPPAMAPAGEHEGHQSGTVIGSLPAAPATSAHATWSLGGRGNYWSDYGGYDANGDGVGDQAYMPRPAFAGALDENPTLRFFQFTLAHEAIEAAAEMLPVYRYEPVIEDRAPLMAPVGPALPSETGPNSSLLAVSALLLVLAAALLQMTLDFDPLAFVLRRGHHIRRDAKGGAS
ncbi:MAG TPA: NosD domain-containing protein [Dehalococcoidia bacterium]|nr:NosD domain-containing protein [Dehalococcoidia bacterium]